MQTGFSFADIYDEVVSRAGGEQSTAEDVIRVRRGMRIVLERWEARGFNTWRVRHKRVAASGTSRFITLPDCIDDIINIEVIRGDIGSSPMRRIPPSDYMKLSNKDMKGSPAQFYLAREECPKLYLFPVGRGHELDMLEIWYVERPEDFDPMQDNMDDVPGRWLEALITSLALDLTRKRPIPGGGYNEGLIQRLKAEALETEDIAFRADRDRSRFTYRIA